MRIKHIKQGARAESDEAKLAEAILDGYVDHHDEIPEGTRIIVIVATGGDKGRMGCCYEGYDEDPERLMFDLGMLAQAVDLGVKP